MGDGGFVNLREVSHPIVDESAITITTAKALWAPALTMIPANYWRPGRAIRITAFGKMTTGATPGNITFSMAYGAGDNPTPIVSTVARALIASVTDKTWTAWGIAECRTRGATGTLRMWGEFVADLALMLSTAGPNLFPASAPADVTIDTTVATNALTFQAARSGSTTETMATTGLVLEELN